MALLYTYYISTATDKRSTVLLHTCDKIIFAARISVIDMNIVIQILVCTCFNSIRCSITSSKSNWYGV